MSEFEEKLLNRLHKVEREIERLRVWERVTNAHTASLTIKGDGIEGAWGESYKILEIISSEGNATGLFRDYPANQQGILRLMSTAGAAVTDGYTVFSIDAPADNPLEATLSLVKGGGEIVDFFNMDYGGNGIGWGLRYIRGLATGSWKDFTISSKNLFAGPVVTHFTIALPSGNVGIGTTAPLSKLSINGGLHVGGDSDAGDDNLLVDGTVIASNITATPTANAVPKADAAGKLDVGWMPTTRGILEGDTTSGRVLRSVFLVMENGTTAATLKCTVTDNWNGNAVAVEDNVPRSAGTRFFLDGASPGYFLYIRTASLPVTCIAVLSASIVSNLSGTALIVDIAGVNATGIYVHVANAATGAAGALTTLVDTGAITINILYITSS